MGNPEWTKAVKFSTLLARKAHESELDSLVSQWTSERQSTEIVSILQAAGVPAGRVTTIPETCDDPQVRYREHFPLFDHLELGQCHQDDFSFRLSRTPSRQAKGVPCLGQDNEYVYCNILGLSDQEFADLLSEGVFE